jgi:hypothetical protein
MLSLAFALAGLMLPRKGSEASGQTGGASSAPALLTGDRLGVMTGGIYQTGNQPLNQFAGPVLYELGNGIGTKWIRLELNWNGQNNADTVAKTTEMAHKIGMRVIVLYSSPERPYVDDSNGTAVQNNIINPYIAYLNSTIPAAFRTNASIPDAFETGNEYNICVVAPCGNFGFRVGGNATAWLARRVKEHFQNPNFMNGRWAGVKVLSGGALNTHVTAEPAWWNAFLYSSAWCRSGNCANNDRYMPFDNVAVHPYNPDGRDLNCINSGALWCWDGWLSYTQQSMSHLRDRVFTSSGGNYRPLFATEYSWQYMPAGPNTNCDGRANCVKTEDQMRRVMELALQAFGESWQTEVAVWADYRSGDGNSGVRKSTFDYGSNRYPAQDSIWYKLKAQAGGTGLPYDMWPGVWVRRFTDMGQYDTYSIEVQFLNRDFVVHGRPNGRYDTWANVTRREFSVFLARELARYGGWTLDNPNWSPFWDVPTTDPDFQYIITLYNRGVISGYGNEFRPGNDLTRAQAAKMFKIANGWPDEYPQQRCQFVDVPPGDWAYFFISTVCNHGLFSGYADGTFRPGNPFIRGQIGAVLYRNFLGGAAPRYEADPPATAGYPVNKGAAQAAE